MRKSVGKTNSKTVAVWLVMIFAALSGVVYGYDIGVISGVFLFVKDSIPMTDSQLSLLASAVLGGGAISTLISGFLADKFGRKGMIFFSSIVFIISVFIISMAHSYAAILTGRLIQGVAIGIVTIVAPLYLTEVMPAKFRGRGTAMFQLFLCFGILISSLAGIYFTKSHDWRGMFFSALIPGILLFAGSLFIVKSPRWLIKKGRDAEALKSLRRLQPEAVAKNELKRIQDHLLQENLRDTANSFGSIIRLISKRRILTPVLIVFSIAILNQLTGINSILQFDSIILKTSGLNSNIDAMLGTTLVTLINFLITFCMLFFVDSFERKKVMAVGTGGACISLLFCGFVYLMDSTGESKGVLMMMGMTSFILFFALGPGSLVWVLLSELLPGQVRSTGLAVALFLNSAASSLLASVFLSLTHVIGFSGVFLLCAMATFIYFLLSIFFIPKTSCLTLEAIEEGFSR